MCDERTRHHLWIWSWQQFVRPSYVTADVDVSDCLSCTLVCKNCNSQKEKLKTQYDFYRIVSVLPLGVNSKQIVLKWKVCQLNYRPVHNLSCVSLPVALDSRLRCWNIVGRKTFKTHIISARVPMLYMLLQTGSYLRACVSTAMSSQIKYRKVPADCYASSSIRSHFTVALPSNCQVSVRCSSEG